MCKMWEEEKTEHMFLRNILNNSSFTSLGWNQTMSISVRESVILQKYC